MAIGKCRECGKEVSSEAKACPHCGISKPIKTGLGPVAVGAMFIGGLIILGKIFSAPSQQPSPEVKKTSEQVAQESAEKARSEARFQKTAMAAAVLKKTMRDPDSLTWEDIRANDDASIICLEYRAKNGFGGMNREFLVYFKGTPSQKSDMWNKHCTQALLDMKYVRHAIK